MQDMAGAANAAAISEENALANLGVSEAGAAIRNGDISSEAYSAALLRRARRYSELNSFISIDESAVMSAAGDADKARAGGASSPLLGVPLGIKDSYTTRGLRTTLGLGLLGDYVPDVDAKVVSAIKDAGAIVFGKANLVEMSYGLTGKNVHHGQVKNPYGSSHISGGSSSGSAAAVAARLVPAALGGDTVGSIRVPAALCGVVGFRPTTGRWSRDGVAPISPTLDSTGPLTRNVEDCALIDQIVTGSAPALSSQPDLTGTKFAYAPRQYLDLVETEVAAYFDDTLHRLRDAGAEITEIDLGKDFSSIAERATWNIFFHETMPAISEFLRQYDFPASFDEIYNGLGPDVKALWHHSVLDNGQGHVSPERYETAVAVDRPELQRRFREVFSVHGSDAILFPTTPCTAPLIEHQSEFTIADNDVNYLVLAKNTVPTSGAGLPGVSIPVGLSRRGLPIGIEIDGAPCRDRALLDVARRVEAILEPLPSPENHTMQPALSPRKAPG
jgi:indoleacetamide hydrolase